MIGLALVSVVAVLGASLRDSANSAVEKQIDTDYALTHDNGFDPVPADAGDTLAAAPGVELASSVRFDQALAAGEEVDVTGVDPTTISRFYDFAWSPGSEGALDRLGGDGAIVTEGFADDRDLAVGSRFAIETPNGDTLNVVVEGLESRAATLTRAFILPYVILYTTLDAIAGLAMGEVVATANALPAADQAAAGRLIDDLREETITGYLFYAAVGLAWLGAAFSAIVAVRKRAPWPALALMGLGALIFAVGHPKPPGPAGMGLFLAGIVWLELRPRSADARSLRVQPT